MKMREAPWSAAAELPPWNSNQKAVADATALQGAFGATILKAVKALSRSSKMAPLPGAGEERPAHCQPPATLSLKSDAGVAAVIVAVTMASLYFFYSRGLTNIYGDSISHMEGARRIFDSLTPGYDEIGSVWLPLFHLLAAPLAQVDFLWRTGLAGSIVSSAAFAGAAWFLYRLTVEVTGERTAGLLCLAGLLLSPNLLYLASTPLTEPLALFWAVLLVYELFRYRETGRFTSLLGAAVAAFLGTLTRYETWYVLPFAALFVLLARRQAWEVRLRQAVLFSVISGFGPLLWLLHNAHRYGNPMAFYNGPFSAQAIYAHQVATLAFRYPTDGHLILAARYYLEDLKLVFGIWPLELTVLGLIAWLANRRLWVKGAVAFFFLVPLPFYIHALAYAYLPLYVPTLVPFTYYNLRYGAAMAPVLALFPAFLLPQDLPPRRRYGLLAFFVLLLVWQSHSLLAGGARELAIVKEGVLNTPCRSPRQQAVIRFLRRHYDGGRLLMAAGKWSCVMQELGIHYRSTISESNLRYWRQLLPRPEDSVAWIIRGDHDSVDELMLNCPPAFVAFDLLEKDSFPHEDGVAIYHWAAAGEKPGLGARD